MRGGVGERIFFIGVSECNPPPHLPTRAQGNANNILACIEEKGEHFSKVFTFSHPHL